MVAEVIEKKLEYKQKKTRTMLEDFQHSSPEFKIMQSNNTSSQISSLSKAKSIAEAQQELRDDLSSSDKGYEDDEAEFLNQHKK